MDNGARKYRARNRARKSARPGLADFKNKKRIPAHVKMLQMEGGLFFLRISASRYRLALSENPPDSSFF